MECSGCYKNGQTGRKDNIRLFRVRIYYELVGYSQKKENSPRTVSSEIDWLISDGRLKEHHTGLRIKLKYLYAICQKDVSGQAAYFRFIRIMEILKNEGWKGYMLTPAKWKALRKESSGGRENLILWMRKRLKSVLTIGGLIFAPELRVCGGIKWRKRYLKIIICRSEKNVRTVSVITFTCSRNGRAEWNNDKKF